MIPLRTALAAATLAGAAVSQAVIFEIEPNDTPTTANAFPGTSPYYTDQALAFLTPGDIDWFSIKLKQGDFINASTMMIDPIFLSPDTFLALFDPNGTTLLVGNDDGGADPSGMSWASAIRYQALFPGTYFLAVRGFSLFSDPADASAYGGLTDSTQSGRYSLLVGTVPVPEPTSMAALGFGVFALLKRRKRRSPRNQPEGPAVHPEIGWAFRVTG